MKTTGIFTGTVVAPTGNWSDNCLPVGTRLNDFEITGILGEGGFGVVYVAFDHSLQRTVAIKEYMPGALAGRSADQSVSVRSDRHKETFRVGLNSFINEARFLAQFDHPSLVKVYRYWEQNQTAYMAMRYYDGRTIKDIVLNTPEIITQAWCQFIVKQILEALETLYKMKILHRDISPDNIIVQSNGDAVLLDFGSARQIIGDLTRGLTVILKPGYAPVEQYAGDASLEQGAWTDIYALSAVMYYAISKQAPTTSIARLIKDPMVPLEQSMPAGYSKQFLAAIDRGLAVQAQDRPQTISEFRTLLGIGSVRRSARVRSSSSSSSSKDKSGAQDGAGKVAVTASAAATPPARSKVRWLAAGAAVVAAIGAATYALSNRTSDDAALLAQGQLAGSASAAIQDSDERMAAAPPANARPATPSGASASSSASPSAAASKTAPASAPPTAQKAPSAPASAVPLQAGAPATAGAALDPKAPPPEVNVSYKLVIKPWADVFVDGKEKGVSPPLKKLTLPPGKHSLRLINPSFPDYVVEVDTAKKKFMAIEYDFSTGAKKTN